MADNPVRSAPILCIDVGERHIGLARAVAGIGTAFPAGSLEAGTPAETAGAVIDLVVREKARCLVIGLPLGLDGCDTLQTRRVRRFTGFIRKELAARGLAGTIHVELVDERFSSVAVGRAAVSEGLSLSAGRATKDQWEAVYILQGYLDRMGAVPERHD